MADRKLLIDTDERGVTTVTLNRPEVHNAFDNELTAMITDSLVELQSDEQTRIVILTGAGGSFSSGADIGWMRSMADFTEEENYEDALRLAELMATLNTLGKPTVARVNGHAFGGAWGLVACCDIAIGAPKARVCLG